MLLEHSLDIDPMAFFPNSHVPHALIDAQFRVIAKNSAYEASRLNNGYIAKLTEYFIQTPAQEFSRHIRASQKIVFATGERHHPPLFFTSWFDSKGETQHCYGVMHRPIKDRQGKSIFILQTFTDLSKQLACFRQGSLEAQALYRQILGRALAVQDRDRLLGLPPDECQSLLEQTQAPLFIVCGADHMLACANRSFYVQAGRVVDQNCALSDVLPTCADALSSSIDAVIQSGAALTMKGVNLAPPASVIDTQYFDIILLPLINECGTIFGVIGMGVLPAHSEHAEKSYSAMIDRQVATIMRTNEHKFTLLAESLPAHVWTASPAGKLDWINRQIESYIGATPDGMHPYEWESYIHADDRSHVTEVWRVALTKKRQTQTEFRLRRADGVYRWFLARVLPIFNKEGVIVQWIGVNADIEDRKITEAALARLNASLEDRVKERTEELMRAQKALRQSQKMEAIGNLAGGIAHDFNNLLQIIASNLQSMRGEFADNIRLELLAENALAGVKRGARLASQLLTFSRRQQLEPKIISVGRVVRDADDLIRGAVGAGVEIKIIVQLDLWETLLDPASLENVLLNLVINARDAIEGKGQVTIEVRNISLDKTTSHDHPDIAPGNYILLSVADNGPGIPPALINKVFEPFFTTKPEGKGTGLGLSTAHGFVHQSGGHIRIMQNADRGAKVCLYFPRIETVGANGAGRTIMVVDNHEQDDAQEAIGQQLINFGYRVLRAANADIAQAFLCDIAKIDLIIMDEAKRKCSEYAKFLRVAQAHTPDLAIILLSESAAPAFINADERPLNTTFVAKPCSPAELAIKIQQTLMRNPPPGFFPSPSAGFEFESISRSGVGKDLPSDLPPRASASNYTGSAGLLGLAILVCEDEVLIRMTLVDLLEEFGAIVTETANCQEALSYLETETFDVLITDVGLPDMSGVELEKRARAKHPDLPVVFTTGSSEALDPDKPDLTTIIQKPYGGMDLRNAIIRLVSKVH